MNHDGLKMWIRCALRRPARRLWQWTLPPGHRAIVLRDKGKATLPGPFVPAWAEVPLWNLPPAHPNYPINAGDVCTCGTSAVCPLHGPATHSETPIAAFNVGFGS